MLTRDHKDGARNIPSESAAFGPGTKSPINFIIYRRMRSDAKRTKRTMLGLNGVDRRSMRRSNCPGSQAAFRCRKLLYSAVSNSIYPPNDTGSPKGRICVAQKPPKPFLRSIQ